MTPQPITYTLEIYEHSFGNDAAYILRSDQPFMNFSIGDMIDPTSWERQLSCEVGTWHKITNIVHRIGDTKTTGIGQQVCLCIEPTDRPF